MDGFEVADADLDTTMQQLHQVVTQVIEATTLTEKKRIEMTARPILREARRKLSALRAEARRTPDPGTRTRYEEKCRDKDDRIRNYDNAMKAQIFPVQNAARPKTYQEQREEEMMGEGGVDGTGFKSSKQVLSAAINVQADALQSLQRTERLQNVTEEQGKATLQELQKQTEKMYQIDEGLENLQGEIDHAMRDVRWFYRQMARDKCCLTLFGLVILAIVVLVFVSIWTKRKNTKKASAACGPMNVYAILLYLYTCACVLIYI